MTIFVLGGWDKLIGFSCRCLLCKVLSAKQVLLSRQWKLIHFVAPILKMDDMLSASLSAEMIFSVQSLLISTLLEFNFEPVSNSLPLNYLQIWVYY